MNPQLKSAKELYAKARGIIEELSNLALETNSKFKFSIAMRQFDYILQIALIHGAIADNDFQPVEIEFIRDITEYGSVIGLFNVEMKDIAPELPDLTWENLEPLRKSLSDKGKEALINQLTEFVDEIAKDFVKWFAPIDAKETKVNYLNRIRVLFDEIINLFSLCDGDVERVNTLLESDAARKVKRNVLVTRWKKAVEDAT